MSKTIAVKESSIIRNKIDNLGLSESQRLEAFAALQTAEAWCDAFAWVFTKLGHLGDGLVPSSRLKHQ